MILKILSNVFALLILSAGFVAKTANEQQNGALTEQRIVDSLMMEKKFEFVGRTALPLGYQSIDLTGNPNSIIFQPTMIESEMPFFGRAFGGVGYGSDAGLRFKGEPVVYTIGKNDKGYDVYTEVKTNNETYRISLSVDDEGYASMTIQSINRSTIRYTGFVSPLDPK